MGTKKTVYEIKREILKKEYEKRILEIDLSEISWIEDNQKIWFRVS